MKKMTKKFLSLLISLVMVFTTSIPVGMTASAKTTAVDNEASTAEVVGWGLLQSGISFIPYIGLPASSMTGVLIAKCLGYNTASDICRKLDEISNEIKALSVQIEKTEIEILSTDYRNEINKYCDLITDLKSNTSSFYNKVATVEDKFDPEDTSDLNHKLEMIKLASMSMNNNYADYIKSVIDIYPYISGTAIGYNESLLEMIYKLSCKDAAFGGEAAQIAQSKNAAIVECVQHAYCMAALLTYADLYVSNNLKEYKQLAKEHEEFDFNYDYYESQETFEANLNEINENYADLFGKQIKDDNSNGKLKYVYRSETADKGECFFYGVVGNYNKMMLQNRYYFIDSVDYSKAPVAVYYVPLSNKMNYVAATNYGQVHDKYNYPTRKTKHGDPTGFIKAVESDIKNTLTTTQIKRITQAINNNPVYGTDAETEITLKQALVNFGFSFDQSDAYEYKQRTNEHALECLTSGIEYDEYDDEMYNNISPIGPSLRDNANEAVENADKRTIPQWDEKRYHKNAIWDGPNSDADPDVLNDLQMNYDNTYNDLVVLTFQKITDDDKINNEEEFIDFLKSIKEGSVEPWGFKTLTADLDLSDYNLSDYMTDESHPFTGTFDGGGHIIKNATFNGGNKFTGLFGYTNGSAYVTNVIFDDVNVKNNAKSDCFGLLIGGAKDKIYLQNVFILGGEITSNAKYVGGLIGNPSSAVVNIKSCVNKVNITADSSNTEGFVGGLVGVVLGGGNIENCINKGNVTASAQSAGGILGRLDGGTVENCTNDGEITSDSGRAGGMCARVEYNRTATFNNNTNNGNVTAEKEAGGIVGAMNSIGDRIFDSNTNNGDITANNGDCGGIVGLRENNGSKSKNCTFKNSTVNGKITLVNESGDYYRRWYASKICGWDDARMKQIESDDTELAGTMLDSGNLTIIATTLIGLVSIAIIVMIIVFIKKRNSENAEQ